MSDDLAPGALLWCAFALMSGGIVKGALGVGTPLIAIPLMVQVLPPQAAVAIMAMPSVAANIVQAAQAPRAGHILARFMPAFVALVIGGAIGVIILARIDDRALLIIVACAVIAFALLESSNRSMRIPPRYEKPAGVGFGFIAGVIGGMSSFFGPMLIIYLVALQTLRREQFIGAIGFLYLGALIPWTLALLATGILHGALIMYSLAAIAPVALGIVIGRKLRGHVGEQRFRQLMLIILLTSGVAILWRATVGAP